MTRLFALLLILLSIAMPGVPAQQPADLDKLLGPVALYPDALLSQMLLCAPEPAKIGALEEWLRSHDGISGSELQDGARAAGFDPPFVAMAIFPDVVRYMATQAEWTAALGKAFTADRSAVFASIQRLRKKAQAAGNLKTTSQQEVKSETTSSGQQVIIIEPANPQVVYVPQYNSTVVYTESNNNGAAVAAGVIGFTAGIAIGAAIDNDYYYGGYGWRGGYGMYDDAWDDWADAREDARDDWQDHREDLVEERGDRREDVADQRGDRSTANAEQRTERTQARQENRPQTAAAGTQRATGTTQEARGYGGDKSQAKRERQGTTSDAFSGYSSGKSERAASQRGQKSRGSSGGGRRK